MIVWAIGATIFAICGWSCVLVWLVSDRTTTDDMHKHHVWSPWEVQHYSGTSVDRFTRIQIPILIREQERRCTECGFTQTQELS
jgi:hypothetical protein